ncbi:SCO family protein [Undibacterium sp. TS12]|uniref:SCO family protein n=1 Tax=Undibacterium sp. TS12 TaxID=2908202 RepID=UPI001F4CD4D3|nr:SCO family protein [Undibacterium sp. TS12]MCH8619738.1 SCO family protein [Undibacterium sp. TS12]
MNASKRIAAAAALALSIFNAQASSTEPLKATTQVQALPGDSIYQLPITLENQQAGKFTLASLAGNVVIISMFYNSCEYVCPMLIDTIKMLENNLDEKEKSRLSVLLVTFDPARDDVAVLQSIYRSRKLDEQHWVLARTNEKSVRQLAATLNIQYRQMKSGEFNHTSVLILLDKNGRILGRSGTLGTVDDEFLQKIRSSLNTLSTNSMH